MAASPTYQPIDASNINELVKFICSDTWEYFVNTNPSEKLVKKWVKEGAFYGKDKKSFFIELAGERIGLLTFKDLEDHVPMFDIRLLSENRGKGIGILAVKLATDFIFNEYTKFDKIECQTRQDNIAMRKVFIRAGYVKEAHYRSTWPVLHSKKKYDSIAYGITRSDWEQGIRTPVNWDDEPNL